MTVYFKINNVKYALVLAERLKFFYWKRSAAKGSGARSAKFFHFRKFGAALLYYKRK